jgi:mannose-6-phosphate isomerase-like protein (cupin superfamily)
MVSPQHPDRTYVHLGVDETVTTLDVTPEFWAGIDARTELHTGRLITSFEMSSDWDSWEMHPAGDEVILVTTGEVRFRLDDGNEVSQLHVAAPHYVVVPTGTWHTADALGTARLVVITWGEGTQHRPR